MSADEQQGGCAGRAEEAAVYALGALQEPEAQAFAEHLRTCGRCREELAAVQPVVDALPAAVAQHSAPAELRGRLLSTVRSEAELQGASRARGGSAEPLRRRSRERRTWRLAAAGVAIAAVSAAIALAFAASGPSVGRAIHATASVPGARAVLRVNNGQGVLRIARMPPPRPGRVYELWVERGGAARATGTLFTVSSAGRAAVGVPGSLKGVTAVMVTAEPMGGSPEPTGSPVIVARLS